MNDFALFGTTIYPDGTDKCATTQQKPMSDDDQLRRLLDRAARKTGEQLGEATAAYRRAKHAATLPTDEDGDRRLVCRRYAERRAVSFDARARPVCYEPGHTDCEGCIEDIEAGYIEPW